MSGEEESVKVIVRVRPLKQDEENCVLVRNNTIAVLDKQFRFDQVLDVNASQSSTFDQVSYLVNDVLNGYNATVFAYGQTGSGKSHTMMGNLSGNRDNERSQLGVVPRFINLIFDQMEQLKTSQFIIYVTYLEIFNEQIIDLLNDESGGKLDLKDDGKGAFIVKDISKLPVTSPQQVFDLLQRGNQQRSVGATLMNEQSSRSHSVFTIYIESCQIELSPVESIQSAKLRNANKVVVGKLNCVDLAGSERQSKSGSSGDRLKEAMKINQSLSALGNVISALSSRKPHVPYRDSKLTKLLMDSLGGSAKTVMIATISPAAYNLDETVNTLRYAQRAKMIMNKPLVNEAADSLLNQYQDEMKQISSQLQNQNRLSLMQQNIDRERQRLSQLKNQTSAEKSSLEQCLHQRQLELDQEIMRQQELVQQVFHWKQLVLNHGDNLMLQIEKKAASLQQERQQLQESKQQSMRVQERVSSARQIDSLSKKKVQQLEEQSNQQRAQIETFFGQYLRVQQQKTEAQQKQRNGALFFINQIQTKKSQIQKLDKLIERLLPEYLPNELISRAVYDDEENDWLLRSMFDPEIIAQRQKDTKSTLRDIMISHSSKVLADDSNLALERGINNELQNQNDQMPFPRSSQEFLVANGLLSKVRNNESTPQPQPPASRPTFTRRNVGNLNMQPS
ncbi:hypothetical protein MP228_009653 [Amoeboaphelidium protococcarum]|nr:hypothetical protein MP228_009653 [Amoeboaphelidium protococcarum]